MRIIGVVAIVAFAIGCKKKGGGGPPPEKGKTSEGSAASAGSAAPSHGHLFSGYGNDDRATPEETEYSDRAASVAAVVPPHNLIVSNGEYTIPEQSTLRNYVKEEFGYEPCADDLRFRFLDERILPTNPVRSCSSIAIAPKIMLTARHCVESLGPADDRLAFVFGFRLGSALKSNEVHRAVRVVARGKAADRNDDWALVEVEPSVAPAHVFGGSLGSVSARVEAAAIGHPNYVGLLVSPGWVEPVSTGARAGTLRGDLDVAEGSSGGPVFERAKRALVGIVFFGDPDNPPVTAPEDNCVRSLWCEQGTTACDGMYVVPSGKFASAIEAARR